MGWKIGSKRDEIVDGMEDEMENGIEEMGDGRWD